MVVAIALCRAIDVRLGRDHCSHYHHANVTFVIAILSWLPLTLTSFQCNLCNHVSVTFVIPPVSSLSWPQSPCHNHRHLHSTWLYQTRHREWQLPVSCSNVQTLRAMMIAASLRIFGSSCPAIVPRRTLCVAEPFGSAYRLRCVAPNVCFSKTIQHHLFANAIVCVPLDDNSLPPPAVGQAWFADVECICKYTDTFICQPHEKVIVDMMVWIPMRKRTNLMMPERHCRWWHTLYMLNTLNICLEKPCIAHQCVYLLGQLTCIRCLTTITHTMLFIIPCLLLFVMWIII